jgi:hypothetical protein
MTKAICLHFRHGKRTTNFEIVEGRFGPRMTGWKLRPVLIQGQDFAQTMVSESHRTITVRLTESTRNHPLRAIYQLAHEAIHCLSPAERFDTLWFEEALANHHALTFPELPEDYRRDAENTVPALYVEPLAAFRSLNPPDTQIKSLRFTQPDFNSWNATLIKQHFKTTDDLAEKLARRLPTYRPPMI